MASVEAARLSGKETELASGINELIDEGTDSDCLAQVMVVMNEGQTKRIVRGGLEQIGGGRLAAYI